MAADRPYGEFYDFYSVSPDYFGYSLIYMETQSFEQLNGADCTNDSEGRHSWEVLASKLGSGAGYPEVYLHQPTQVSFLDCLTLADGTNTLSRNVGK
jgi:hypothetical protein